LSILADCIAGYVFKNGLLPQKNRHLEGACKKNGFIPEGEMSFKHFCLYMGLLALASAVCTNIAASESVVFSDEGQSFSKAMVIELARELAREPFKESEKAPKSLTHMDYSTYRKINFQQNEAIWGNSRTKFSIQLFAPGYLYENLVDIDVVENGRAYPVKVTESSFHVPHPSLARALAKVGKYAGIRLHYPINCETYKDEFIVFQGASYFRAVSRGQVYGLSARGLAIDVAQPKGEEFAFFKRFWIERPSTWQEAIVVHALLDSKSVTGAYRFGIYPGAPTWMQVDATLFPRSDIGHLGLAPLTSMFMHGPMDRPDKADYRPTVHDSGALAIIRGNGEPLWRPLSNPHELQVSAFLDENPMGFGLIQRNRRFAHYQDLEAKYHCRPSAWVEPRGDWGKGQVELVEIPSGSEGNDNIVVYWRPAQGLKKGQPFSFAYRLTWPDDKTISTDNVRIVRSASGEKLSGDSREIVIDYSPLNPEDVKNIEVEASISNGRIIEARIQPNPPIKGARVFVNFYPGDADVAELRVQLKKADKPFAATWLYRWVDQKGLL